MEDRISGLKDKLDVLEEPNKEKNKEVQMEHIRTLGHYEKGIEKEDI
jgi:predicted Zn-dependent protease